MENNTYFKINSVEELKEVYIYFQDEWDKDYSLEDEIRMFNNIYNYIFKNSKGIISLTNGICFDLGNYKEVPNPLKADKPRLKGIIETAKKHGAIVTENKYQVQIKGVKADVYDVLKAFDITCPATQHAIKKLLKAGKRGYKDAEQDLDEAISSINRAKELQND